MEERHKSRQGDFIWQDLLPGWQLKGDEQGESNGFHNTPETRDAFVQIQHQGEGQVGTSTQHWLSPQYISQTQKNNNDVNFWNY